MFDISLRTFSAATTLLFRRGPSRSSPFALAPQPHTATFLRSASARSAELVESRGRVNPRPRGFAFPFGFSALPGDSTSSPSSALAAAPGPPIPLPSVRSISVSSSLCGMAPSIRLFTSHSLLHPSMSRCRTNVLRSMCCSSGFFIFLTCGHFSTFGPSRPSGGGVSPASPSFTRNESVKMFSMNCEKLLGLAESCSTVSVSFWCFLFRRILTIRFIAWSVCWSAFVSATLSGATAGPTGSRLMRCATLRSLICVSIAPFMNAMVGASWKCFPTDDPNKVQLNAPSSRSAWASGSTPTTNCLHRRAMNCAGVIAPRPPIFLAISTPKSAAVAMTSASKSCSRGLTTSSCMSSRRLMTSPSFVSPVRSMISSFDSCRVWCRLRIFPRSFLLKSVDSLSSPSGITPFSRGMVP
mmetsp:Transcript_3535/g.14446  ORF Transcript_3535/g.14446 Transcript_3535/m.14446 type:complete len:411 (-) Transcript_3535:23-1255(-)